jgi:S1-C subfamily serine protease
MRKFIVLGLVVVMALSAGTILAQGDDDTETTDTAWLGVRLVDSADGVTVRQVVTDSPAEAGGLLVGDVIVSVDGEAVESADALIAAIQAHAPGDALSITVSRDGTEQELEIELGAASLRLRENREGGIFNLGEIDPLVAAEKVLHVELAAVEGGYEVLAGGRLSQSEWVAGDVITAVNGTPVEEVDWAALVTELSATEDATLTITAEREGEEITVESPLFQGRGGGRHGERQGSPRGGEPDSVAPPSPGSLPA